MVRPRSCKEVPLCTRLSHDYAITCFLRTVRDSAIIGSTDLIQGLALSAACARSGSIIKMVKGDAATGALAGARSDNHWKISKQVAATLAKYCVVQQPIQVPPHRLLTSRHNRGGAPPNINVVHQVLLTSFKNDGYDPRRCPAGYCQQFKSQAMWEKELAFNQSFP